MMLLLDIGNSHTHLGLGDARRVGRRTDLPTRAWLDGTAERLARRFVRNAAPASAALCSVVPQTTPLVQQVLWRRWGLAALELNHRTVRGIGVHYPRPETIGPDRLANAVAACRHYGAPVVVVDFGTAVTFDVVDRHARYVGGIIAPGLDALTDYLHDRTALLPRVHLRDVGAVIGKSTRQAMLIGVVHGYRGLVRHILLELKQELGGGPLRVVATGGYAALMARQLPEIQHVLPGLTLEGLRLVLLDRQAVSMTPATC